MTNENVAKQISRPQEWMKNDREKVDTSQFMMEHKNISNKNAKYNAYISDTNWNERHGITSGSDEATFLSKTEKERYQCT